MKKYFYIGADNFELGTELMTDINGNIVTEPYFYYDSYKDMLMQLFNTQSKKDDFCIQQDFFNDLYREQAREILSN